MPDAPDTSVPGAPPPAPDVVLGVDYGKARVGLALGFADSGLVLGLPVLRHPGQDHDLAVRLAEVARARDATVVVLGHPLHANGRASPQSRAVEALRVQVAELLPRLRVELEDERLTSVAAEAEMREHGLRWWQVPKGQIDTSAAIAIVRSWLTRRDPRLALEDAAAAPPEPDPPPPQGPPSRRDRRRSAQRRRPRRGGDGGAEADEADEA